MDEAIVNHGVAAVVMVHATAEAEAIAAKSGMSITDLFRPFTVVEANMTLHTTGEPYRLRHFGLRFVHTSEFRETEAEHAEHHLTRLLASYDCKAEFADAQSTDLVYDPAAANAASMNLPPLGSTTTPWLSAFRQHLATSLRHSEGMSLDYPVGILLVASAREPKPVATFNSLSAAANATHVLADGLADPSLPRTYLLLDDLSEAADGAEAAQQARPRRPDAPRRAPPPPLAAARPPAHPPSPPDPQALADAQRAFGPTSCHLARINSRAPNSAAAADIWASARPAVLGPPPPPGAPPESRPPRAVLISTRILSGHSPPLLAVRHGRAAAPT